MVKLTDNTMIPDDVLKQCFIYGRYTNDKDGYSGFTIRFILGGSQHRFNEISYRFDSLERMYENLNLIEKRLIFLDSMK